MLKTLSLVGSVKSNNRKALLGDGIWNLKNHFFFLALDYVIPCKQKDLNSTTGKE